MGNIEVNRTNLGISIVLRCYQDWYLCPEELVDFFPLLPDMGCQILLKQRRYYCRRVVDNFLMLVLVVMILLASERQAEPRRD